MKGIDLITSSARLAGFLGSGESLQDREPADCLMIAQQMLDTWQADGLKIFGESISKFPLVIGTQTYKLGPGLSAPDFGMARPAKIQRMGIELTGSNPTQPPEIPISVLDYDGWANIRVKNIQGNYPLNCYPDYAFPNMNLSFYQIPGLACNAVIYSWQPLNTFPDLNTDVTFPPAYMQAIRYNLAIMLAAEFKTQPDALIVSIALSSLTALKDLNLDAPILSCESGLNSNGAYYDWRSDTYVDRR